MNAHSPVYSSLAAVGALVGGEWFSPFPHICTTNFLAALTDRMKRRYVLSFGTLLLSITLAVFVGLTSAIQKSVDNNEPISKPIGKGAIGEYRTVR